MSKLKALARLLLLFFLSVLGTCNTFGQVVETTEAIISDPKKSKIISRFTPPKGFAWLRPPKGSFSEYLVHFPLLPPGFPIRDYRAIPVENQDFHMAVLKIDVGDKDLQQCADAWMRLYAEYLWANKRFDEIGFEFTSGQYFAWKDYSRGVRTREHRKRVTFVETGLHDDSYFAFRQYLNIIFRYAGTISLDRESRAVANNADIQPGDFIIKPGSPGHSVIVVGVAENVQKKRLYLLAESFMPAQDVHILKNPENADISPWYELDVAAHKTVTAKYSFEPTSIKRFHAIP